MGVTLLLPQNHETGTVYVASINPGHVPTEFAWSMLQLLLHDREGPRHVHTFSSLRWGPNVGQARDYHVAHFFDSQAHWLLQLDSDMEFPADLIDRMLAVADPERRPIVAGLYLADGGLPLAFENRGEFMQPVQLPDGDTPVEVDGVGAGCLLVHFSVFVSMHRKWPRQYRFTPCFSEVELPNGQVLGEDLSFCWRARHLGIPITLLRDLNLGHVKSRVLR
jgi:hypothetical protein